MTTAPPIAARPAGKAWHSQSAEEVLKLLQELNRSGITIVLVTHEQDIAAFASRLIAFRDGKIVSDTRNTPADAAAALAQRRAEAAQAIA